MSKFKKDNKAAEKYTEDEAIELFEQLIADTIDNDYLSTQEALMENRDLIPYRSYYYLLKKFSVLQSLKKELEAVIIARVNRGAILKEYSTPMAIWRCKQNGEVDKMEQEITQKNITVEV